MAGRHAVHTMTCSQRHLVLISKQHNIQQPWFSNCKIHYQFTGWRYLYVDHFSAVMIISVLATLLFDHNLWVGYFFVLIIICVSATVLFWSSVCWSLFCFGHYLWPLFCFDHRLCVGHLSVLINISVLDTFLFWSSSLCWTLFCFDHHYVLATFLFWSSSLAVLITFINSIFPRSGSFV